MYSARERGENPFQHACLEVRSGRRLEKRFIFALWLQKIVVNALQKKKREVKTSVILAFALLSLKKLQM